MPFPSISFTVDLEDPSENYLADGRYIVATQKIVDLCNELNRKATFFVVGRIAETAPDLIKIIASSNHEIAFHSHNHVSLTEEDPTLFQQQTAADKDRLEQLSGKPVVGFRAPRFSLTPKSIWALDILKELGFQYSASIMPTNLSLFGFPNAPRTPFLWPNGLIELPLPVANFGPLHVPYLGGIYLYATPMFLTRWWLKHANSQELLWTYTHPYDFDTKEPYQPMPNTPTWISLILWLARRRAKSKIKSILQKSHASTLIERIGQLSLSGLPQFSL